MPKKAAELTALQVNRLKDDGDHHVGGVDGLLLRIAGGSRAWVLRVRIAGQRRNLGLGAFPEVSLLDARDKARQKRQQIRQGDTSQLTVSDERRQAKAEQTKVMTFKVAAGALIESMRPSWKNPKHADQWANTLEAYAYPKIGDMPVPDIDTPIILEILRPIWYTKSETASRVRGRTESVIDYYAAINHVQLNNPARWKGHLDKLLPPKSKVSKVKHHKAVPWKSAPDACKVIASKSGMAAKALMAVVFTASRFNEVTGMVKGELNLSERLWIVPGERMKVDRDNHVPLSTQMIELLISVGADHGEPTDLVFPGQAKSKDGSPKPLSDTALTRVMQDNGIDATTHGWRSTFKDWAAEATQYPNELSEMQLAHTIASKVESAYRRGEMLEKRRPMVQEWADYVAPSGAACCRG
jgi:integrase